jgi:hypothetical protein
MTRKYFGALVFFIATCTTQVCFATNLNIPKELNEYAELYNKIEHSKNRQSLDKLFVMKDSVRISCTQALVENPSLEKELAGKLRGYIVVGSTPDSSESCNIDSSEYLKLAKKKGTDEDIKFFELYSKHFELGDYLQGDWPNYLVMIGDTRACAKVGDKIFSKFYKDWNEFLKIATKTGYKEFAKKILEEFNPTFIPCSCDSKEQTIAGLKALAKTAVTKNERRKIIAEIYNRESNLKGTFRADPPNKNDNDFKYKYNYNGNCGDSAL